MNIELIFNNKEVIINDVAYNLSNIVLLVKKDTKYLSIKSVLESLEYDKQDIERFWIHKLIRIIKIEDNNKIMHIANAIVVSPITEEYANYKWIGLEIKTFDSEQDTIEYSEQFNSIL